MFEQTGNNKTIDYKYNNLNQQVSKTVDGKDTYTMTYDKRGNFTGEYDEKFKRYTVQYEYDGANRMVKGTAYLGESVDYETSEYIYNGLGDLVGNIMAIAKNGYGYHDVQSDPDAPKNSKTSVVEKKYVIDYTSPLKNIIMESETYGLTYRYTYGLEKLSVTISEVTTSAGELVNDNNEVKLYYHHDPRLGTTEFLTDDVKGKVTSYIDYDEWGAPEGKAVLKLGLRELDLVTEYTTYSYDPVLEVYYAKARMYDASSKRFLAVDPVKGKVSDPQTMIQYTYVLNNPLTLTDPFGLDTTSQTKSEITTFSGSKGYSVDVSGSSGSKYTVSYNDISLSFKQSEYNFKDGVPYVNGVEITDYLKMADIINSMDDNELEELFNDYIADQGTNVVIRKNNLRLITDNIKQTSFNFMVEEAIIANNRLIYKALNNMPSEKNIVSKPLSLAEQIANYENYDYYMYVTNFSDKLYSTYASTLTLDDISKLAESYRKGEGSYVMGEIVEALDYNHVHYRDIKTQDTLFTDFLFMVDTIWKENDVPTEKIVEALTELKSTGSTSVFDSAWANLTAAHTLSAARQEINYNDMMWMLAVMSYSESIYKTSEMIISAHTPTQWEAYNKAIEDNARYSSDYVDDTMVVNNGNESGGSQYPSTREALHQDLTSKGYTAGDPSPRGYVTYKGPNGATVTIKPTGEVIPTQKVRVDPTNTAWNAPTYSQRLYYDGTPIPDGAHTTGHFVEPFQK